MAAFAMFAVREGATAWIGLQRDALLDKLEHQREERVFEGVWLRDRLGNDVFGTNTHHLGLRCGEHHPGDLLRVAFAVELRLGAGSYSLSVAVHAAASHVEANYDWWDRALVFQVHPADGSPFAGVAQLPVRAERLR